MPFVTLPIGRDGPMIDLAVALSTPRIEALKKAGRPFSPPVTIRGLIDTGASLSAIDPFVIQKLSLTPTGSTLIHSASSGATPHPCNLYDICLAFLRPQVTIISVTMPVFECDLASQGFHALVGRDVLERCLLVCNGPEATFTLAFLIP
jgi:hypothetical protein